MAKPPAVLYMLVIFLCLITSCSSSAPPISPEIPGNNEAGENLPGTGAATSAPGHHMLGIFSIAFDPLTETVTALPNREVMAHYNVTPFLFPPHCDDCLLIEVEGFYPEQRLIELKVELKNPFPLIGYDVRGILMHNQPGWDIKEPNGYTSLFDDGGEVVINPFRIFEGSSSGFLPGETAIMSLRVTFPEEADFSSLHYVVEASWPGHCEDVQSIDFEYPHIPIAVDYGGGNVHVALEIIDWQDDVISVTIDAVEIAVGVVECEEQGSGYWTADFYCPGTSGGPEPGQYRLLITALSNSPYATYHYLNVFLNPLPPPFDVTPRRIDFGTFNISWANNRLTSHQGLYGVDIFDTSITGRPVWASFIQYNFDINEIVAPQSMLADGSTIYINDGSQPPGLRVIDIENPYMPVFSGTAGGYYPDCYIETVAIHNGYLYAATGSTVDSIAIFDLSTTPLPGLVGFIDAGVHVQAITAHDGCLYFVSYGKIYVADLTDPQNPALIGLLEDPLIRYEVRLRGYGDYLFCGSPLGESDGCNIIAVNVSTPSLPEVVGVFEIPVECTSFAVKEGYAYVTTREHGAVILDVHTPEDMIFVDLVETVGAAMSIAFGPECLYIGESAPGGLSTFDLAEPTNPVPIDRLASLEGAVQIAIYGDYAAVIDRGFNSMGWTSLRILDIDPPERTHVVGTVEMEGYSKDLTVDGQTACVLVAKDTWPADQYALNVIYMDEPDTADVSATVGGLKWCRPRCITSGDGYAYIGGIQGFCVVDIDPATDAYLSATYQAPKNIRDIVYNDGRLYFATVDALVVYDVSDPADAVVLGELQFPWIAEELAVKGDCIYVGSSDTIYVVNADDPSEMSIADQTTSSFSSGPMSITGGFLFTASGHGGLGIFKIFPQNTIEAVFNLQLSEFRPASYIACKDGYMYISTGRPYFDSLIIYKWW